MKIGIVNDLAMATQAITAALNASGKHHVLWTATNGHEAIELCQSNIPELVLMDLVMPGINGAATTHAIMQTCPTAILVVTASVATNCALAFEAMGAGALDVITTPTLNNHAERRQFLEKIAQIEAIIADHRAVPPSPPPSSRSNNLTTSTATAATTLVAIGCSAGGPAALATILQALDPLDHAAVVLVQHIDARFINDLAQWLTGYSHNPLHLAADHELIAPGHIYLAGKNGHVKTNASARFCYDTNLRGLAYQPSVDVFFASIARHWQGRALGTVLTGMGRDGATGLRAMRDAGFLTLAQDQKSSALYGMPKAAAPFATEILPLTKIAPRINRWLQSNP